MRCTVRSHLKNARSADFFQDLVIGEIMKLTRWLSASADFTVVLLVDTPFSLLRPLPTGRTQKRAKMMALFRVKGACCMPFFLLQATNMLCVSKHAAIMANGGL